MEENKINISVFAVEIKSEKTFNVMLIVTRENKDSKIPSVI